MSAPMRAQVESDYAEQDSWRFAESPVETKDLSLETEQENEGTSPGPLVVRTLKDPPEIWDLVREAPTDFNPGGAFVSRLTSSKTKVLLMMLAVVFVAGLCFVGVRTLRDGRNRDGAASHVQDADGTNQTVSAPEASDTASAPVNAGTNTKVSTQSSTNSVADNAVASQSTLPPPANSNPEAATADPAVRNSMQPTGESVSHFSKLAASASGGAEAFSANKRAAVASSARSPRKENENVPDTSAVPQTSHASQAPGASEMKENPEKSSGDSASSKESTDQTSNPTLRPPSTSAPPSASAPKAKVIRWP